jgi:hypothetical protein
MHDIHIGAALAEQHREHLLRQAEQHHQLQVAKARSRRGPDRFRLATNLRRIKLALHSAVRPRLGDRLSARMTSDRRLRAQARR